MCRSAETVPVRMEESPYGKVKNLRNSSMGNAKILYRSEVRPLWVEKGAKKYLYGKMENLYNSSMGNAKILYGSEVKPLWVEKGGKKYLYGKMENLYDSSMGNAKILYGSEVKPLWAGKPAKKYLYGKMENLYDSSMGNVFSSMGMAFSSMGMGFSAGEGGFRGIFPLTRGHFVIQNAYLAKSRKGIPGLEKRGSQAGTGQVRKDGRSGLKNGPDSRKGGRT